MFKLYKDTALRWAGAGRCCSSSALFALFFVFQNTIELRGASFLWLPDLKPARPPQRHPAIMGLSMFGLSKGRADGHAPPTPRPR